MPTYYNAKFAIIQLGISSTLIFFVAFVLLINALSAKQSLSVPFVIKQMIIFSTLLRKCVILALWTSVQIVVQPHNAWHATSRIIILSILYWHVRFVPWINVWYAAHWMLAWIVEIQIITSWIQPINCVKNARSLDAQHAPRLLCAFCVILTCSMIST